MRYLPFRVFQSAAPAFLTGPAIALPATVALALCLAVHPSLAAPCVLSAKAESVRVARALDGDTLALADGRTVRLAGILAPKAPLGASDADWPLADATAAALQALVADRPFALRPALPNLDRHGRIVGYLSAEGAEEPAGLSADLVARGLARVAADRAGRDCRATLLAAEGSARRARLGLWANTYYEVRDASDGDALAGSVGRFEIAEGRVASVRTVDGRLYVNFGRRWRDALALVLTEAVAKRLGGAEALGLARGARLRVRGMIERRLGPTIAVTEAAQIERLGLAGVR